MSKHIGRTGFAAPPERALGRESRHTILAELATIAGLVVSTLIAMTVVTVGIAHASVADGVIDNDGGLFVIALMLGLFFIGLGGLTLFPPPDRHRHRH